MGLCVLIEFFAVDHQMNMHFLYTISRLLSFLFAKKLHTFTSDFPGTIGRSPEVSLGIFANFKSGIFIIPITSGNQVVILSNFIDQKPIMKSSFRVTQRQLSKHRPRNLTFCNVTRIRPA